MSQVAIPVAGKTTNTAGISTSSNPSGSTASTFHGAGHQPSASAHTAQQQQQSTQSNAVSVTLPPAPYTLLPGYVSRPHIHDHIHPLPSEPLARAVSLLSTGPSLGAWEPPQPPLKAATPQVPHASANEQSDLWTDLAAELRSAPISASAQPSQAPSAAHSKDLEGLTTKAGQSAQQEPVLPGVPAQQAQSIDAADITEHAAAAPPVTAKAMPKRKPRRKLVPAEQSITSPADGLLATTEQELPQTCMPTRASAASNSRAHSRAAATALTAAAEAANTTEADAEEEPEPALRADPSRQAKNAAFKGSGALGLSRRLSSRLLTPQEVNVMAKLPLPPALQRLEGVLFPPVNGMYGFLLRQHIQVSCCVALSSTFCY